MLTCDAGPAQSRKALPTHAMLLAPSGPDSASVPMSVRVNVCKAAVYEGLRLRCAKANCKFRDSHPVGLEDNNNNDPSS
eukprot:5320019-Lingulodinium_polyedra.AAC.1